MNRFVLIAGMPASGKSTFARYLAEKLGLPMVSKDRIKELMYDTVGFKSRAEKITLSIASSQLLYYFAESLMQTNTSFILENNFENVSKPGLQRLLQTYTYKPLTVRFGGDVRVIYERYLERNTQTTRHGGHKTNDSWPPQAEGLLMSPLPMEEFVSEVYSRGIAEFNIGGEEIYVDSTDFSAVSYAAILEDVSRRLNEA